MQLEQQSSMVNASSHEIRYERPVRSGDIHKTGRPQVVGPSGSFEYAVLKRLFDVVAVLIVSPFVLPLVALIALAVRFSSPGPAFFSHRRICQGGVSFSMWKFRTMSATQLKG